MLAGLCLFWRLQGTLSFLVFSGFQRLPAFLGLWSLPPSKPAVTGQVSLPLHPSDHCLHHLLLDSQSSASLLHFQGFSPSFVPDSATPWAVACQALLSMGFSRQEYWSGLPSPSPGNLPDPGIKQLSPVSPALQAHSLPAEPDQDKNHFPFFITVQFLSYSTSCFKITIQTLSISSPLYAPLFSPLLIIKK